MRLYLHLEQLNQIILQLKELQNTIKKKKPHVITSKIEHKCVLESVRSLEAEGHTVHFINVD